jgi:hypothetical protein
MFIFVMLYICVLPFLLQWDETGRMSGTDTRATMTNGFVGDGEFSKIMTDHLGFNLDLVKSFPIVNTHHCANHFRYDDHVSKVSLDHLRLVFPSGCKFGFAKAL